MLFHPVPLLLDQRLRLVELPRLRHHREHHVERATRRRVEQRARLHLHQPLPAEREAQRAPAHRGVLVLILLVAHVGYRFVAADVDGAEHHRAVAGRLEHSTVEAGLALAPGQRR